MFEYKKITTTKKKSIAIFIQFEIRCRNQRKISGLEGKNSFCRSSANLHVSWLNGCSSVSLLPDAIDKNLSIEIRFVPDFVEYFWIHRFYRFQSFFDDREILRTEFRCNLPQSCKKRKTKRIQSYKKYRVHVHYNLSYK